jgi:hypothetical protein
MDEQIFTDGVGRISVIGGIVRLDLVTYSPKETDAGGQPRPVFTQRLVMGTDAFLRSSEKILEIVQQITARNAARPTASQAAPQPAPRPAAPQAARPAPAPAPVSEPPHTTGPLFPDTRPTPPKAPFP